MAFKGIKKSFARLKDRWGRLSSGTREAMKVQAFVGVATPVLYGAVFIATGLMSFGTMLAIGAATMVASMGMGAWLTNFPKEWRDGQKRETWKNDAGQTVESTYSQKLDLQLAQRRIDGIVRKRGELDAEARGQIGSVLNRFNPVAAKARIVDDAGNAGPGFRFVQKVEKVTVEKLTLPL